MPELVKTLCVAIKERRVIQFYYRGERRQAEPFILGYMKKRLVLSAYRVGGYTRSSNPEPWRHYYVNLITRLTERATTRQPQKK